MAAEAEAEVEAAALSQLQLQLISHVSDLRLTRQRERAAREELHTSTQRWKEAEAEHRTEARELRAELAARDDALQRHESRVKFLESEIELLERNEKDLKENIERLLQSREAFMRHYEDSACSLQWTIQMRDKQIAVISEKLNSHLALFNSVGKEVASVKQVLGDVACLVGEKENVVSDLKCKIQRISVLEKDFVEKLSFLGAKTTSYQLELQNRARIIYGLKDQLEAEKLKNNFHPQLEELKKSLLVKDEIIERLISDKQEMLIELHNMETALQKFQDAFSRIGREEMKSSLSVSESQDRQDHANEEQVKCIPGSQVDLPNEHRMIPIIDETANANAECKSGMDIGSNQVQNPPPLKRSALPCSDPVTANVENHECPHESEDIEMGNSSPDQKTDSGV